MLHKDFAAGVIVVHLSDDGEIRYLILKSAAGHWEHSKGHPNPGETWTQTGLRELAEETGIIDIALIAGFSRQIRYVYRDQKKRVIDKVDRFALGRVCDITVWLSEEHSEFRWLNLVDAISLLTYATTRAVLRDADAFIRANVFWRSPSVDPVPMLDQQ